MAKAPQASFFALTPDRVLDAVEVGGLRSTGRCLPLRAFENRVYEVELEDQRRLVVKFYRPGRWSRETILDEHRFLLDLAAAELPAFDCVRISLKGGFWAPGVRAGSASDRSQRYGERITP
jgi:Ser/Thr protein kinase RdoA (MazF antagonist)